MPYTNGDSVYACLRVQNPLPIGQTDTAERIHRVTVGTGGQWSIGDTVKVKETGGVYRFFGYDDATDLAGDVYLVTQAGVKLDTTTTGQGTDEATITLNEAGPAGEDLIICYRVGIPAVYDALHKDRKNDRLNVHCVNLTGGDHDWDSAFNKTHRWAIPLTKIKQEVLADGMSIQENPPV